MDRTRPLSDSAPTTKTTQTTKEHTMSLEPHKGAAIVDERTCTPKPVLAKLHDTRTPAFGRWLGQINRQD